MVVLGDFLTPALEVALAGLLERGLIDVGEVWVTARRWRTASTRS